MRVKEEARRSTTTHKGNMNRNRRAVSARFSILPSGISKVLVILIAVFLTINIRIVPVHAALGDLDPSFGSGGTVLTQFLGDSNAGHAVAIQADGKIVAAGESAKPFFDWDFAVARYNSNGTLDATFGSGGKVTTDMGGRLDSIQAIAIQEDGKIVAVGQTFNTIDTGAFHSKFAAARYNSDGSLDPTFGNGGKVVTLISSGVSFLDDSRAFAVVIQTDGKIVAGGWAITLFGSVDFALVRYNSDGSLDSSFGIGGIALTNLGSGREEIHGLAQQPDGKLIAGGVIAFGVDDFIVLRYNQDGTLDSTFATFGRVITDFNDSGDTAFAMARQPDGKIILAGRTVRADSNYKFALARYLPDGNLDSSFGDQGKAVNEIFGTFEEAARAVVVQPNGKIVVAGGGFEGFLIVRYKSDGALDTTFGNGGIVKTVSEFSGEAVGATAEAIALQEDGRIVAVGQVNEGFGAILEVAVARYIGDAPFDKCIQDDSSGSTLQLNSTTGEYLFTNCLGLTLGGAGTLRIRGTTLTLEHTAMDRRVLVKIDGSARRATASIRIMTGAMTFTITDRNTANNNCACK